MRFLFGIIAIVTISVASMGFEFTPVFADGTGYLMAEDISAHLTFKFRDGIEKHEFPVFKTTADFVSNQGTSFQVQGVVSNAPHLHKAFDEAFKYSLDKRGADYNYRYFDIDVDFTHASGAYDIHHLIYQPSGGDDNLLPKDVKPRKTLHYIKCQLEDYFVTTQPTADGSSYRPYVQSETGFAIVDTIDFKCGGIRSEVTSQRELLYRTEQGIVNDFPKLEYNFADDIHTFVTFEFDNGMERIEFPIFKTISGFGEDDDGSSIHAEGVVNRYPLLSSAIDNARDNKNTPLGSNIDFDVKVEFVQENFPIIPFNSTENNPICVDNVGIEYAPGKIACVTSFTAEGLVNSGWGTLIGGDTLLRGIDYKDCRVTGSGITTYYDHEEGFVWAGGFGILQTTDFDCGGMSPLNPSNDAVYEQINHNYNMANGPHATAEFRYQDNTIETIDFPTFRPQDILSPSNPTFQLEGIVGDYPILNKQADDAAKINKISGVTQASELFDVDVNLKYDDQTIRGFSYSNCRVIDYIITTQQQNEEGFWVGFAFTNTFEFECQGFQPKNPTYDALFEIDKADTTSSLDLKETDTWGDEFTYTKP